MEFYMTWISVVNKHLKWQWS